MIVFIIVAIGIYLIGKRLFKKDKKFYTKKQEELRKYNKREIPQQGVLFRWKVYFDADTPFIDDLDAFCTRHGELPLRFVNNRCPIQGCENNRNQANLNGMKNINESDLINRLENMK